MATSSFNWSALANPRTTRNPSRAPANPIPDYFGRTPDAAEVLKPVSFAKVPGADPAVYDSFAQAQKLAKNLWGDAETYRRAVSDTLPATTSFASEEIADIDRVYSPTGYRREFADIRDRRRDAVAGMTGTMLQDLRRALNLDTVGRGGVSGSGLGSYLTSRASSEIGRLRAAEAYDASAQERADLAQLMAGRAAMQGRRSALIDSSLQRLLTPGAADATATNAFQQALSQALNQALANLVSAYGLQAY